MATTAASSALRTRSNAAYKGLIRLANLVHVDGLEETDNIIMSVRQHFRRTARMHAASSGPGEGFEAAARRAEVATDTAAAVHDMVLGALQRTGRRDNEEAAATMGMIHALATGAGNSTYRDAVVAALCKHANSSVLAASVAADSA